MAQDYAAQMRVEIKTVGDRVVVKTIWPKDMDDWRRIQQRTINYDLYAPKRFSVALEMSHGNVRIEAFDGKLQSKSSHGNLHVSKVGKNASIKHAHGDVEVYELAGDTAISHNHGDLIIDAVKGGLDLEHNHGNVEAT
jgi:DUF4097 and DUF4098 domain-containing protein YvlB